MNKSEIAELIAKWRKSADKAEAHLSDSGMETENATHMNDMRMCANELERAIAESQPDTVEYWKSRAETAELKVLTFHEKIVELGDGEPSSPPDIVRQALMSANEWAAQYPLSELDRKPDFNAAAIVYTQTLEALGVLAEKFAFGESGAAQEVSPPATGTTSDPRTGYLKQEAVSPPSPEPVCPMCCKPVFTDGYEGDTRELKAALKLAKIRLLICLGRFRGCEDESGPGYRRHEVSTAEIPAWIEEINSLLG